MLRRSIKGLDSGTLFVDSDMVLVYSHLSAGYMGLLAVRSDGIEVEKFRWYAMYGGGMGSVDVGSGRVMAAVVVL